MRFRAPAFDDAPAVLAVLAVLLARESADLGMPDDTLEEVLDEWRASDLDLAAVTASGRRRATRGRGRC